MGIEPGSAEARSIGPRASPRSSSVVDRLRAVPAWAWLAAIVVVSFASPGLARARHARARSSWSTSSSTRSSRRASPPTCAFAVRGVPSRGYGVVYPMLIAPGVRALRPRAGRLRRGQDDQQPRDVARRRARLPDRAARRRQWLALLAALLAVAVPSMVYTGTVMTENAYYPVFLLAALALVAMLERPTPLRQVALLAAARARATRRARRRSRSCRAPLTAPLLLALFERRGLRARCGRSGRALRRRSAPARVLVVAAQIARGRSLSSLLGAYARRRRRATTTSATSLHFVVYHAAELDLYLGVDPGRRRDRARGAGSRSLDRAAAARCSPSSLALSVWLAARRRHLRLAVRRTGSRSGTRSSSRRSS